MSRIYISGPITDNPEAMVDFGRAQRYLESEDFEVVNPVHNAYAIPNGTHSMYMHVCFAEMDLCDGIYMLKGWENSRGANMEHARAVNKGMTIMYQK